MVLRRYHGPASNVLSSKKSLSSSPLDPQTANYEDRGFLNMAISHLQTHRSGDNDKDTQENPSSTVVTNAEINQPRSDEHLGEKNISTDLPGNRRR